MASILNILGSQIHIAKHGSNHYAAGNGTLGIKFDLEDPFVLKT